MPMLTQTISDPLTLTVVVLTIVVIVLMCWDAFRSFRLMRQEFDAFRGGLSVLRQVGLDLCPEHPIRKRLESAPVVDLSFEEIAHLLGIKGSEDSEGSKDAGAAAAVLVKLRNRLSWIERYAQFAIYFGIIGTVTALVISDTTDLTAFRSRLPIALITTLFGLFGAIVLSWVAGKIESGLEDAAQIVRDALLKGSGGES